jgi:hypothetical protein
MTAALAVLIVLVAARNATTSPEVTRGRQLWVAAHEWSVAM